MSLFRLNFTMIQFSSVQFIRSVMSDSKRPHESQHARPPCPSPTPGVHSDSRPIESVMPSSHLILCRPLLLLPTIPPNIRVFSNESTLCMRWPKYWSFSFSIIPSKEIPGLISFRMDWLNLLAVQGTLRSLLQHHSSKTSILPCSAFLTVHDGCYGLNDPHNPVTNPLGSLIPHHSPGWSVCFGQIALSLLQALCSFHPVSNWLILTLGQQDQTSQPKGNQP